MGQGCDASGTAVGSSGVLPPRRARAVVVAEGDGGYGHRLRCCVISGDCLVVVKGRGPCPCHHVIVEGGGCCVVAEVVIVDGDGCVVNVNVIVIVHSRRSAITGRPWSCYAGGGCSVRFKVISGA